jgi:WD40 repeat protein
MCLYGFVSTIAFVVQVFVSCSVDRSLRVWDVRQASAKANMLTVPEAHSRDINVIHWNRREKHLLASGGDDGIIKIWDLRMFKVGQCLRRVGGMGVMVMHVISETESLLPHTC